MKVRIFFQDALTYAIPAVLTRAIGLLLLPFYARYLSPAEYGVVEILTIVYVFLNLVLPLEVSQAVARQSADSPSASQKTAWVSTALVFTGLMFGGFALFAWITPAGIAGAVLQSEGAGMLLAPASLWMLANALFYLVLNQLRWDRRPRGYGTASLTFAAVTAGASVIFIAGLGLGLRGYIWGQCAGSLAGLAAAFVLLRSTTRITIRFDIGALRAMLAFSSPLVLSGIAAYLALYVDRWLLLAWRGSAELGIYAAAYRIASIVTVAVALVQLALTPLIYAHHQSSETPPALRRIFRYFLLGACSFVLGISALAPEIVLLLAGSAYQAASDPAPWLCLGMVLANVYLFAPGLILAKRTGTIAALSAASAGVNVIISAALIPSYGANGAAIGMISASGVSAALYVWFGERHFRVSYEWRRAAVALIIVPVIFLFHGLPLAWRIALLLVACGMVASILLDRSDFRGLDGRAATREIP